jgi:hypothetical protein
VSLNQSVLTAVWDDVDRARAVEHRASREREEAEIAEHLRRSVEPPIGDEEAADLLIRSPQVIGQVEGRVRALYFSIRRVDGCPIQKIDNTWLQLRRDVTNQPLPTRLQLLLRGERQLYAISAARRSWSLDNAVEATARQAALQRQAEASLRAVTGAAPFDAASFISRLAAKAAHLSVNPAGKLVCTVPSALTEADRQTINQRRADLIAALKLAPAEV